MTHPTALPGTYPLQLEAIPEFLRDVVASFVAFLPRLVGAIIILLLGWIIGRAVARVVVRLADRIEIDRAVLDTPLGAMLGGTERAVSHSFGVLGKWFVYALAILAAADALAIPLLSQWIQTAVSYLPAFIAGLLIIVGGFVVADFIGDAIRRTRTATQSAYTGWFAGGVRMFLYFTAIVIGLDTMGIDVGILFVFARAMAWGLAAAIAIGVGIALGWGGKDYVANNMDRWAGRASSASPGETSEPRETNGGATRSGDAPTESGDRPDQ